jgi:hypothetical protein
MVGAMSTMFRVKHEGAHNGCTQCQLALGFVLAHAELAGEGVMGCLNHLISNSDWGQGLCSWSSAKAHMFGEWS